MDARLYETAIDGNVDSFLRLIEDDHDILDRIVVGGIAEETPLHVAAHFGHVDLVRKILIKKPEFANILNCQGETPLHLASEKGHKEVVKALLQTNSDVCFIRDKEGRSPLHVAAIKGRVGVLEELVRARIKAAWISTDRKEPLLHLCVNHNQFDALKKLVELINDDEFMNMKDADDNNVFHLLAAKKQIKVIKFLVDKTKLDMNAKNVHGFTAFDGKHGKNKRVLKRIAVTAQKKRQRVRIAVTTQKKRSSITISRPLKRRPKSPHTKNTSENDEIYNIREALLVVAILITTMTFQTITNPPGGIWQESSVPNDSSSSLENKELGEPIMGSLYPREYRFIRMFSTIGFISSLFLIILVVSGFTFHGKGSRRAWVTVTWIMIASLMGVYAFAYDTIRRKGVDEYRFWPIMMFAILIVVIGYVAAFFWFLLHKTKAMLGDGYHWVKNQEWFSTVKLGCFTKAFGWNSRIFHTLKTPYNHDTTNGSTV